MNYFTNAFDDMDNKTWNIEGNGSFLGFTQSLSMDPPVFAPPTGTTFISQSSNVSINIKKYCKDYDSAFVTLDGVSMNTVPRRGISSPDSIIAFTWAELSPLSSFSFQQMTVGISKYAHRIINDKIHVFEFFSKERYMLKIVP